MKILVAEANRLLARAVKRGLEEEGFVVKVTDDLSLAKHLAELANHDVIVVDVPPRIELAILRHWRRSGITTPVLFLSVPGGRADRFDELGLGPAAVVAKPFHLDDLLSELRRIGGLERETRIPFPEAPLAVLEPCTIGSF